MSATASRCTSSTKRTVTRGPRVGRDVWVPCGAALTHRVLASFDDGKTWRDIGHNCEEHAQRSASTYALAKVEAI